MKTCNAEKYIVSKLSTSVFGLLSSSRQIWPSGHTNPFAACVTLSRSIQPMVASVLGSMYAPHVCPLESGISGSPRVGRRWQLRRKEPLKD